MIKNRSVSAGKINVTDLRITSSALYLPVGRRRSCCRTFLLNNPRQNRNESYAAEIAMKFPEKRCTIKWRVV
jgi:hypothetical protein